MFSNHFNFSEPQKLDKKAFFLILTKTLWTIIKSFGPIALIFLVKGMPEKNNYLIYAFLALILFVAGIKLFVDYYFFTYQIVNDELIIKEGWLTKSTTVVKFDKIHEVNLSQKFIHKLIGLYFVGIDSAGSSKTEISINGISHQKALALKEILTNEIIDGSVLAQDLLMNFVEQGNGKQKEMEFSSRTIKISISSLVKIGITRNYIQTFGILLAFSFQIIDQIQDLFYDKDENSVYEEISKVSSEKYLGILGVVIVLGVILIVITFNLVRTIITYYNYQLQLKNGQISASYGLTDSHLISVPSNKVQLFTYQQNYFQRIMNLFEIKIKQVDSSEDDKRKKGLLIPGANFQELNEIFEIVYRKKIEKSDFYMKPSLRKLLVKLIFLSIPFILGIFLLYYFEQWVYSFVLIGIFVLISFLLTIGFRNEKLFIHEDALILEKGIWDISTSYLHISKIQQFSLEQSYFQEKKQLGSLTLHTAGGAITLSYYAFSDIKHLANKWTFQIEKNKYSWM